MNRAILILTGTTFVFGSASAYFWQAERAASRHSAALQSQVQELEDSLLVARAPVSQPFSPFAPAAKGESPAEQAPSSRRAAAKNVSVSAAGTGTSAAPAPISQFFAAPTVDMNERLKDPEYRSAMEQQQRAFMPERYPDLADALQLLPEQYDQLMDILARQQIESMTRSPPFNPGNGAIDRDALRDWQQQMQQQRLDQEAQLAGVLGDAKMQQWKEYQQEMPARMQIKQLRNSLDGSPDPLRRDQIQPLVAAIGAEQQYSMAKMREYAMAQYNVARNGSGVDQVTAMEQHLENTKQSNQRLHDAVAPYLSRRQLEQFDRMMTQQLTMQRASLLAYKDQAATGGPVNRLRPAPGVSLSTSAVFVPATPTQ